MNMNSIVLLVVMIAVFYALLVLPQRRQRKNRNDMMSRLGPGAKIVTSSGIYGKVIAIQDDVLTLKIAQDVTVEMDPRAVLRVVEPSAQQAIAES